MALTPQEELEMLQLEEEEHQHSLKAGPGAMDTPSWVPEWYKQAAGASAANMAGKVNSATLGYGNLEDLPGIGKAFEQASKEHPIARAAGSFKGAIGPGMALGTGTTAAGGKLLNSAPGRVALGVAGGGIEGLLRKPQVDESRLGNAYYGARNAAIMGGGMETIAKGMSGASKLATWFGRKAAGLTPGQAQAFKGNPKEAERLADIQRNAPEQLIDEVQGKIKGGLEDVFENLSEPLLEKMGQKMAGRTVQVDPNQFKGTAAMPEIQRAWELKNPQKYAPYSKINIQGVESTPVIPKMMKAGRVQTLEPAQPQIASTPVDFPFKKSGNIQELEPAREAIQYTPVEQRMSLTKPVDQAWYGAKPGETSPFGRADVPVSEVEREMVAAGPKVTTREAAPAVRATPVEQTVRQTGPKEVIKERVPAVRATPMKEQLVRGGPSETKYTMTREGEGLEPIQTPPLPENFAIDVSQALRGKRLAGKAADHARALNPIGYNPSNDAEAAAASKLKKGIEGAVEAETARRAKLGLKEVGPSVEDINKQLSQAANYSDVARSRFKNNAAAILTESESTSSVPTRAMRNFIDEHSDAGLNKMADQLAAGTALQSPLKPEGLYRWGMREGASGLLKSSAKSDSAEKILQDIKLQSLFNTEANKLGR